jgi:uncharacterized protein YifE (UPF0438 family)
MADPSHTTLSSSELGALTDRLYSRGISKIGEFTVEQSRDLRIASQAIRELLVSNRQGRFDKRRPRAHAAQPSY